MAKIIGNTTATPNPCPDWAQTNSTKADYIKNKPTILTEEQIRDLIPDALADLSSDPDYRTVTDAEKETWNAKSDFSGSYNDLADVPSTFAPSTHNHTLVEVSDTSSYVRMTHTERTKLSGIDAGANKYTHPSTHAASMITGLADVATSGSYNDLSDKPTIPSISGLATETYVDNKVASLVDSSPETLNTLNELAAALGDNPNFATTVADEIGKKVDKVDGKGLSTNDYTTGEKNKLAGIAAGAEVNVQADWDQTDNTKNDYIKNKPDFNGMNNKITALESQIADILYTPIGISSFSHNAGTKEMGATVTNVTLSWTTNKMPSALTLDGAAIDKTTTSKTISGLSITWNNNKTWTLKATDERGASDTETTSITFCNGIYYGVGNQVSGFDSSFVTKLNKTLRTHKAYDFTVNPTDQYIYYAVPKRLGTVLFKVGGFEGGFEVPETVSVTNSSGYTEDYYVYRSTNKITGSVAVDVT